MHSHCTSVRPRSPPGLSWLVSEYPIAIYHRSRVLKRTWADGLQFVSG
jgi:hypothetical protein